MREGKELGGERWIAPPRSSGQGRIAILRLESRILQGNPLGDPDIRDIPVYLPPSYDDHSNQIPVVYCLSGFTGSAWSWFNFQAWVPTINERADRLIAGGMPEMVLVFPDCFTRYGGSQYLDSPAVGNYRSFLTEEIIPAVEEEFRVHQDRRYRAVMGKSSGGYGALMLAMQRADLFSAVACHSGDMYFEYCYLPDLPPAFRALERNGGLSAVLDNWDDIPKSGKDDHALINTIAMSACYSPNPDAGPHRFDLPFSEETGELRTEIWQKWKEKDPLEVVRKNGIALKDYGLIFLDCGKRDEFSLHIGARLFSRELNRQNISYEYEEFDGGHFQITHRYDASLTRISRYFQS